MFEFIGMVVVAWVGWSVLKVLARGASSHTLARAAAYAADRGVPLDASTEYLQSLAVLKRVRKERARASNDFACLDLYEQYGQSLMTLHRDMQEFRGHQTVEPPNPFQDELRIEQEAAIAHAKGEVRPLLEQQILALKAEGCHFSVDYVTFAYVGALACVASRFDIDALGMKDIVEYCFRDEMQSLEIDNAWDLIVQSPLELMAKVRAFVPIAEQETSTGRGDYFVRYSRKANRNGGLHSGPRPDLSKVRDDWFLDV